MLRILLPLALCCVIAGCQSRGVAPSAAASDTLSIAFTGDVLLDRGVRTEIEHHGISWLFGSVKPLWNEADAVLINLECPLTDSRTPVHKKYIFRAEPEWADSLRACGVTHAAMANNHTNDQGRRGLADTRDALVSAGITPLGYGLTPADRLSPAVISKGDIEVAIFNSVIVPIENWQPAPDGEPDICQASGPTLARAISQYKAAHQRRRIIAVVHWGSEYHLRPSMQQRHDAALIIKAGADAIVGHHPHVLQPIENIDDAPIAYSLGNFIFDSTRPEAAITTLLTLKITPDTILADTIPLKITRCRPSGLS